MLRLSTVFGDFPELFFIFSPPRCFFPPFMLYCPHMELFSLRPYMGLKLCVAVSGGRDSVALLHYLHIHAEEAHITLSALTCDHGIRKEAASDAAFVKDLCAAWGVPLITFRADVPARATKSGRSLEEEGRAFRRECYAEVLKNGADAVLTAHHRDDYAETVLFRLARGTSLKGLDAFPKQHGLLRPLLGVTRADIDAYIRENDLPFREDESNADVTFARNRIRHEVLPALEQAVPGARENLVRFAERAARDDAFLESLAAKEVRGETEKRVRADLHEPLLFRACLLAMRELGLVRDYTEANLQELAKLTRTQAGRRCDLPAGITAYREGEDLVFVKAPAPVEPPESVPFALGRYALFGGILEAGEGEPPARLEGQKALCIDLAMIPEGAVWRTRREGDTFRACSGRNKTLKKFLTDRKIPARVSSTLPVLAKESEILAVAGVELADEIKRREETAAPGYLLYARGEDTTKKNQ